MSADLKNRDTKKRIAVNSHCIVQSFKRFHETSFPKRSWGFEEQEGGPAIVLSQSLSPLYWPLLPPVVAALCFAIRKSKARIGGYMAPAKDTRRTRRGRLPHTAGGRAGDQAGGATCSPLRALRRHCLDNDNHINIIII